MYCYVWEFFVRPDRIREFETVYGQEGDWVRLFRRDPAYLRTLLLRDRARPDRFVTIDFWASPEAYAAFREKFASELRALDARGEASTVRETPLGKFDIVGETRELSR